MPSYSDTRARIAELLAPEKDADGVDWTQIAMLAAVDALNRVGRLKRSFADAQAKVENLEKTGVDRDVAVGAGIDLVTAQVNDTAYRETLFKMCCEHFGLTPDAANACVEKFRSIAAAMGVDVVPR